MDRRILSYVQMFPFPYNLVVYMEPSSSPVLVRYHPHDSSLEMTQLEVPEKAERCRSKPKRELKTNITSELWQPNVFSNGSLQPMLRHTHDSTENPEAEANHSGHTWRKEVG